MTNAIKNNHETDSSASVKHTMPAWLASTFFGVGHLRPGSGTWASVITVLLWWFTARASHAWPLWLCTAVAALIVTAVGIYTAGIVASESGLTDPGFIVIDEVAGQLIALLWIPLQWQYALASFILFRSFDILKPPPLRKLEHLRGGWGIMLDDVGAGVYSLALLQIWLLWAHAR